VSFLLFFALLLHADGGVPNPPATSPPPKSQTKPDDPEVVKNLELLELMDETSDLELLQELSVER
jgi:hypothetical protein